jgi:hypothetical protein
MLPERKLTLTIASGAATSDAAVVNDGFVGAIDVPTIDSATLKVQGRMNGADWRDLYDETGTLMLSMAASTGNRIWGVASQMAKVMGVNEIRLVAGANQTADRVFTARLFR